ncbi:MAG: ATP-grasp domain-containing protein [Saprospiraceae bacterium]
MYYIIQKNVFVDPRYDEIFRVLEALNLPFEEVQFFPNSNDFEYKTTRKDVFVYGSVKLAKVTKNFDWQPGSFYGGNHEYVNYANGFGEFLLNPNNQIFDFSDTLDWTNHERLFIKPSQDAKSFTGKVFTKVEWEDFQYYTLSDKRQNRIKSTTKIQTSTPQKLIKEARIWIVNRQIVTSSYYHFYDGIEYEEFVSDEALAFAKQMANHFNVADAYVLDIALTLEDWRVVEVNCINSAGFYKADVKAIVLALEAFYKN